MSKLFVTREEYAKIAELNFVPMHETDRVQGMINILGLTDEERSKILYPSVPHEVVIVPKVQSRFKQE